MEKKHCPSQKHQMIVTDFCKDYYSSWKTPIEQIVAYAGNIYDEFDLKAIEEYQTFEGEVYDYLEKHGNWHDICGSMCEAHLAVLKDWLEERVPDYKVTIDKKTRYNSEYEFENVIYINGEETNDKITRADIIYNCEAYSKDGKSGVTVGEISRIEHMIGTLKREYSHPSFNKFSVEYSEEFANLTEEDMHHIFTQKDFQDCFTKFEDKGGKVAEIYVGKSYRTAKTYDLTIKDFIDNPNLITDYSVPKLITYIENKIKKTEKEKGKE